MCISLQILITSFVESNENLQTVLKKFSHAIFHKTQTLLQINCKFKCWRNKKKNKTKCFSPVKFELMLQLAYLKYAQKDILKSFASLGILSIMICIQVLHQSRQNLLAWIVRFYKINSIEIQEIFCTFLLPKLGTFHSTRKTFYMDCLVVCFFSLLSKPRIVSFI